ncbi:hypothetical protein GCM10007901_20560 [Dyella acidisoli]|uniref:Uncharacterized protein n=1 Tax=Dyella acidisoli TaxID=1867834 RepID=A0ABQ5XRI5_9GAMM|nr:hypothetical protein GCM10007901_20560 [Dyella acidisoli]
MENDHHEKEKFRLHTCRPVSQCNLESMGDIDASLDGYSAYELWMGSVGAIDS